MRGPKPSYAIQLLEHEVADLQHLVNARNAPQGKVKRARIIVYAHHHPEASNQTIAQAVGCSDRMVRKWRRRWCETKNVADLPRPGAPRRFSP